MSGINNLLTPAPIVCEIAAFPSLPPVEDSGYVTLSPQNQTDLLLYVESLEDCVSKIQ